MKDKILEILRTNARMKIDEIAARSGLSKEAAKATIAELEKEGIICGYTAVLNESVLAAKSVRALIEVKVTPSRDGGFDQVAKRIAKYPEVTDLYLVSGSYDLLITVEGESLNEVASFVSAKLSTIEGVISTSTAFQLKKYKESNILIQGDDEYERLKMCP